MLERTRSAGVLMGKGPLVSAGEVMHVPVVVEVPEVLLSFLQEVNAAGTPTMPPIPRMPFLRNSFRFMMVCFEGLLVWTIDTHDLSGVALQGERELHLTKL